MAYFAAKESEALAPKTVAKSEAKAIDSKVVLRILDCCYEGSGGFSPETVAKSEAKAIDSKVVLQTF